MEEARTLQPNIPALNGWREIQDSQRDLRESAMWADLLGFLSHVGQLASETFDSLRKVTDDDVEIALAHFDQIDAVVNRFPHLSNNTMEWSLSGLDNGGVLSIRVAGSILNRYFPESSMPEDKVQELLQGVRDLMSDVHHAEDLDEKAKRYLLDLFLKIERSLEEYRFFGVRAVESALNETTGALRRNVPLLSRLSGSKIMHTVVTFVLAVDVALNMGANAKELRSAPDPKPSPVIVEIVQQYGIDIGINTAPAIETGPAAKDPAGGGAAPSGD